MAGSMAGQNKNYITLDICKWVMALFVIAIHTHPLDGVISGMALEAYNKTINVAVPVFFVIAGFLLFNKTGRGEAEDLRRIKSYTVKLLRLYVIWTIIYLPLALYDYSRNGISFSHNVIIFFKDSVFLGEHYYSWPLWYLLSSVYSLFVIYMLIKFRVSLIKIMIISLIVFIFGNTMTELTNAAYALPPAVKWLAGVYRFFFGQTGRLFTGMAYISAGALAAGYKLKFNKYIIILSLIFSFTLYAFIPFDILSSLFLLIFAYFLTYALTNFNFRAISPPVGPVMRKSSAVMYFTHMIFFFVYTLARYKNLPHYGADAFIVAFMCTLALSSIVIILENKGGFKWLKIIF